MEHTICPWYFGYVLANPLRALYQNPQKILGGYIKPGMKVLEIGPGMGFFSIPMARMVGNDGKIICVDVQDQMLRRLRKRAHKNGLDHVIETWQCSSSSLAVQDQKGKIDFALAFAVVHEIPNQENLLKEIYDALKQHGLLFVAEPRGHVIREAFDKFLSLAQRIGFSITETPDVPGSHSVVLVKNKS
jgi:ubiquinone/menaquinone biosynthesis C-methylase UbiE